MKKMQMAVSALSLLAALWLAGAANAAVIQVTIDTSSVNGQVGWLTFDLIDGGDGMGGGDFNTSSVKIDPFATDGTLGVNVIRTTGATGTLPSAVTLNDVEFFNEYMHDVTLGDEITFTFETTGAFADLRPDGFSFFLFAPCPDTLADPNAANGCIPYKSLLETTGPGGALFLFNVGGGFEGGGPYSSAVTAAALPEPGSLALGMAALLAIGATRRGKRRI